MEKDYFSYLTCKSNGIKEFTLPMLLVAHWLKRPTIILFIDGISLLRD